MSAHLDRSGEHAGAPMPRPGISRRRLFELGGTAAFAAALAACGGDEGAPGRVGNAPEPTPLPDEEVNDAVYLRTVTSLEHSILAMYARFQEEGGLEGRAAETLDRFVVDHTAAAERLAELTTAAGGEPYECPNPWYEERYFAAVTTNLFGDASATPPVVPSEDIARDTLATMYSMESLAASSYLRFVGLGSTPDVRHEMARLAGESARRAAATALIRNPPPAGYVAPALLEADAAGSGASTGGAASGAGAEGGAEAGRGAQGGAASATGAGAGSGAGAEGGGASGAGAEGGAASATGAGAQGGRSSGGGVESGGDDAGASGGDEEGGQGGGASASGGAPGGNASTGSEAATIGSEPGAAPPPEVYALNTRFGQLVAVDLEIGAVNELGLRYRTSFETPAENAYIYPSVTCAA